MEIIGETIEDITHLNRLTFINDGKEVSLGSVAIEESLDNSDIEIVFGADLLRATKWAIYGPTGYIRLENY